ncbi:hypothetical protein SteCoe_25693 [Stentor coeruleus]|uniref:Protein kinase domain-containing protein n=1 Tax=Stentor coeruleus TaxID=5963 RepID=A0A1R2BEX7_9CILI|nr:hypothetical protein SteCoe_25693 [Stentor coeruleus]
MDKNLGIRMTWDKLTSVMNPSPPKLPHNAIRSTRNSILHILPIRNTNETISIRNDNTIESSFTRKGSLNYSSVRSSSATDPLDFKQSYLSFDESTRRNSSLAKKVKREISQKLIRELFTAKCADLQRDVNKEQENLFVKNSLQFFVNNTFSLCNMSLSGASAKVIAKILQISNSICRVNLEKNHFGSKGCIEICTSIKKNQNIIDLNLSNNDIVSNNAGELINLLITDHLISINLSSKENLHKNTLGNCPNIEKLFILKTLNFLNLAGTKISKKNFLKIKDALRGNTGIIYLNLSHNKKLGKGFKGFTEALATTRIEELMINGCKLKDINSHYLAVMIKAMKTLRKLDLSENGFTDEGMSLIISSVGHNNSLKWLNISKNKLVKGIPKELYDFFINNHTLECLKLSNCFLRNNLSILIPSLQKAETLQKLDLSFNEINNEGAYFIAVALQKNFSIKSLNLSFNNIKNKGGISLSNAIEQNPILEELNLKDNSIKNKAAERLYDMIHKNKNIIKVNLKHNLANVKILQNIETILNKRMKKAEKINVPEIKKKVGWLKKNQEKNQNVYKQIERKNKEHNIYKDKVDKLSQTLHAMKGEDLQKKTINENKKFEAQQINVVMDSMLEKLELEAKEFQNSSALKIKKMKGEIDFIETDSTFWEIKYAGTKAIVMIKNPKYLRMSQEYNQAIIEKEKVKKILEELKSKLKTLHHELFVIKNYNTFSLCFIDEKHKYHTLPVKFTKNIN